MKLSELKNSENYVGLYVFDFGEQVSVGFTTQEVAELFESEKYKDCKAYKIHKAYPDGKLELKGVPANTFQLEMAMVFYSVDGETAKKDFDSLVSLAVQSSPPCRSKVHLAQYSDEKFATIIIYPAEYNDEVSSWLLDNGYKTNGSVEGGVEAAQRYYDQEPQVLQRHQLFGQAEVESRTGKELLGCLKKAVQR